MTFALLGVVVFTTSSVLWFLRAVLARELRWKVYALRDALRDAAFQDRALLDRPEFWKLDRSLTTYCRHLDDLSLWTVLPFARFAQKAHMKRQARRMQDALALPPNGALQAIYDRSILLLAYQLILRHWIFLPISLLSLLLCAAFGSSALLVARRVLGPALLSPPVGGRALIGSSADVPA